MTDLPGKNCLTHAALTMHFSHMKLFSIVSGVATLLIIPGSLMAHGAGHVHPHGFEWVLLGLGVVVIAGSLLFRFARR